MILAAGRGERLRPLTDSVPKPLVRVGQQTLIERHLQKLSCQNFNHIVINVSYLAEKIIDYLGDGSRFNTKISYSIEPDGALGSAGGIVNALDLLEQDRFVVLNGDILTDYNFSNLQLSESCKAHLVLVPNPAHNVHGDYNLVDGMVRHCENDPVCDYTFAGIGLYHRELFAGPGLKARELANTFSRPVRHREVSGEVHRGLWIDVGNRERLAQALSAML